MWLLPKELKAPDLEKGQFGRSARSAVLLQLCSVSLSRGNIQITNGDEIAACNGYLHGGGWKRSDLRQPEHRLAGGQCRVN